MRSTVPAVLSCILARLFWTLSSGAKGTGTVRAHDCALRRTHASACRRRKVCQTCLTKKYASVRAMEFNQSADASCPNPSVGELMIGVSLEDSFSIPAPIRDQTPARDSSSAPACPRMDAMRLRQDVATHSAKECIPCQMRQRCIASTQSARHSCP